MLQNKNFSLKQLSLVTILFLTPLVIHTDAYTKSGTDIFAEYIQTKCSPEESVLVEETEPLKDQKGKKPVFKEPEFQKFQQYTTAAALIKDELKPNFTQTHDIAHRLGLPTTEILKPRTTVGEMSYVQTIHSPTPDAAYLAARQNALITLQDSNIQAEVTGIYDNLSGAEKGILPYFAEDTPVTKEYLKQLYFSNSYFKRFNDYCNKNSIALEITSDADLFYNVTHFPLTDIYQIAFFLFINFVAGVKITQISSSILEREIQDLKNKPLPNTVAIGTYEKIVEDYKNLLAEQNLKQDSNLLQISHQALKDTPKRVSAVGTLLYEKTKKLPVLQIAVGMFTAFRLYQAKNRIMHMWEIQKAQRFLQKRLVDVSSFLKGVHKLETIILNNEALVELPELKGLCFMSSLSSATPEFQELIRLLFTSTFNSESFFASSGRVRAAHTLMLGCLPEIKKIMAAVGAFDVLLSSATLITESADKAKNSYALPTFIFDATKPYIKAVNFWHPELSQDIAVANTLFINGSTENPHHSVITGPNTGGKSTILKSIMVNAWLAQTLGIVAAEEFVVTPFTNFNCYMNITDDINEGQSLFAAEVDRVKQLIENFVSLKSYEFGFAVLDEIFTGTAAHEAEQAAILFMNKMSTFNNCITLTATHFPQLTQVERIKNYKVTVIRHDNGSLERPFKLEPGISDINIAFEVMKQSGLSALFASETN